MVAGNGYRDFAAAFNRGDVKPDNVIAAGLETAYSLTTGHSVQAPALYEIVDAEKLRRLRVALTDLPEGKYRIESLHHADSGYGIRKSRKVLQGAQWRTLEPNDAGEYRMDL